MWAGLPLIVGMRFLGQCLLVGAALAWFASVGCSKKVDAPPAPVAEQPPAPESTPPPAQNAASVQIGNAQQVNASWDAVSKDIANQNYENAVRAWMAMDQARQQAAMNEALRQEYARRAYQAQDALRQKAETDAKARKAYQDLGRIMMGR